MSAGTPEAAPHGDLERKIGELDPVSLDELDRRAALQRRTDRKYVVSAEAFAELLGELAEDHDALEIDGRRSFAYESVYFDTPDLRCFFDHVEDRLPRFKVRTRLYVDTGRCEFEVKISRPDGDTDKRSVDQERDACGGLTDDGRALVADVADLPPDELRAVLRTSFTRMTLAARDEPERVTIDLGVRLTRDGGEARFSGDHVLIESKTRDGNGRLDELLAARGIEPVTLSKYRLGVALLERPEADRRYAAERARWFDVQSQS